MSVAVAVLVGFLAARLVWLLVRPVFSVELFLRENFRGHRLPTSAGLVIMLAVVITECVRTVVAVTFGDAPSSSARAGLLALVLGLAVVGLVDDLAGSGDRRGFRGHLAALGRGQLTTGALKLFGGTAIAVTSVAIARPSSGLAQLVADAAVVALAANLANLADVAPGRAIKVGTAAFLVLALAAAADPRLTAPAVVVGAALGLLLDDLRERLMLGDAGANVLGGAVGFAVVLAGSPTVRLATLATLLVFNGLSEWVSFSRVIERVGVLRAVDRAGRRT